MKRALPALTRDLGRKLFALALALVVWWRVHQGILDMFKRSSKYVK